MARAVWTGTLAFGLVTIPVRLFPATEPKDVRFHLVDARGRRVRYRRFVTGEDSEGAHMEPAPDPEPPGHAPTAGPGEDEGRAPTAPSTAPERVESEVGFHDLMRGYETDEGTMVVLGQEEIEAARPERSRTIDIEDFVDLADIDPVYFEKSYHVVPQPGAEKPYALLLRAMERAGRVGIGRFVLRTKPHLVAIRPAGGVLALETLFFGDEVRDGRELVRGLDVVDPSERELEMAEALIETLATAWNPAAYADTYREELLRRIAEKAPVEVAEEPATSTGAGSQVEELMRALKASVEAAKASRSEGGEPTPRARKPRSA